METNLKVSNKSEFIESFKNRTKQLSIKVIQLFNNREKTTALNVIAYQLIKSSTSTAANYRAACIARSKKEFFSKISITVEEADETVFWLEILKDSDIVEEGIIQPLLNDAEEILKVLSKAKTNTFTN
ncbi:MAG: four helix bundle protein [Aquimarina sp.]|nr:four helix bundle protein [Aquimarina sp.]